jgi:hypothetical protein
MSSSSLRALDRGMPAGRAPPLFSFFDRDRTARKLQSAVKVQAHKEGFHPIEVPLRGGHPQRIHRQMLRSRPGADAVFLNMREEHVQALCAEYLLRERDDLLRRIEYNELQRRRLSLVPTQKTASRLAVMKTQRTAEPDENSRDDAAVSRLGYTVGDEEVLFQVKYSELTDLMLRRGSLRDTLLETKIAQKWNEIRELEVREAAEIDKLTKLLEVEPSSHLKLEREIDTLVSRHASATPTDPAASIKDGKIT